MENTINEYMEQIIEEFTKQYLKELDEHIIQMLEEFGFKGNIDDVSKWLEENEMNILMDEDKSPTESNKLIYLVDKFDYTLAFFIIKMFGEEDFSYEISDVFFRCDE